MKKLCRSNKDSLIAGICGGIAEYYKTDVTVVRMAMVLATIVFTPLVFVYIIGIFIIPEVESAINSPTLRKKRPKKEQTEPVDKVEPEDSPKEEAEDSPEEETEDSPEEDPEK